MPEIEVLPALREVVEPARDEQFFARVVAGEGVREASEACGLSLGQAYRRLHAPAFQQRLSEARQAATASLALQVGQALSVVAGEAIEVLRAVMADPQAPASTRVNAAGVALRTMLRLSELEDLRSGLGAPQLSWLESV